MEDWQEITNPFNYTIDELLKIIDEATGMGFEFKVENHAIYFRETT